MKFRDLISNNDPSITNIPSGYSRYGHIMLLRSSSKLPSKMAEIILSHYPWCQSVYQQTDTKGISRIPEIKLLGGIDNPKTLHIENGAKYNIDISRITFSPGNRYLRERLVNEIKDSEHLVDMFSAVGNLSLQPLIHKKISATLIEQNEYTFSYLQKNIKLNGVQDVELYNLDSRKIDKQNIADRIFMGYHDADKTHLISALKIAKKTCIIHLHPIVVIGELDNQIKTYNDFFNQQNINFEILSTHKIKNYSPKKEHIEIQYKITKNSN